ncbi:MAG: hypothetical protein OEY47_01375 [Candidatus Bathyarchaeota archaeon]|nr:hypothetical protein [Candidatus Bathyarchaeota archaeon]
MKKVLVSFEEDILALVDKLAAQKFNGNRSKTLAAITSYFFSGYPERRKKKKVDCSFKGKCKYRNQDGNCTFKKRCSSQ